MGKGKNLKAALQSQQSRFKAKEKLSHAAQVSEQRSHRNAKQQHSKGSSVNLSSNNSNKGKGKATPAPPPRRTTIPFRSTDTILLIGEGNFSFARALLCDPPAELCDLPPKNLTATAYDTEDECYEKYADGREIVAYLRQRGAQILFGVDATKLEKTAALKGRRWDHIVWNFPHAGKGITDQDRNILSNQVLILGFLRSASKVLSLGPVPSITTPRRRKKADEDGEEDDAEDETAPLETEEGEQFKFITPKEAVKTRGTVLITLRNVVPYTLWDVPRLAKKPPLPTTGSTPANPRYTLLRSFAFNRSVYKGYEHRMTKGTRAHGTGRTGEGGEDRTWEFCLQDE
ncbi:hypothetical protein C0993_005732 [Termitomyces sp. T159_Od127]|nr:hypothetical protein C0993_005732 [Termitomyces sp. T159_Od127]